MEGDGGGVYVSYSIGNFRPRLTTTDFFRSIVSFYLFRQESNHHTVDPYGGD